LPDLTGHPVRGDYKRPEEPDVLPPADALVVAPAAFNMINKWAAGISDTLALGLLNEAIGLGLPVVAVPTANVALVHHPAFVRSVAELRTYGVRVLFDPEGYPLPTPNMGAPGAALFLWEALFDELIAWTRERQIVGDLHRRDRCGAGRPECPFSVRGSRPARPPGPFG
jgi:hypothetical protein